MSCDLASSVTEFWGAEADRANTAVATDAKMKHLNNILNTTDTKSLALQTLYIPHLGPTRKVISSGAVSRPPPCVTLTETKNQIQFLSARVYVYVRLGHTRARQSQSRKWR